MSVYYDVGVVGFWYGINYGSVLTYYSLYRTLEARGLNPLLINKHKKLWNDSFYSDKSLGNRFFSRNSIKRSQIRTDAYDWWDLNKFFHSFLLGSDVVWKYTLPPRVGYHFFLDFVWENKKKIAYASSFGGDWVADAVTTQKAKYFLKKFDFISCRENEGVDICKNIFDVSADQVLDPVFLLDFSHYEELAEASKKIRPKKYICTYILGPGLSKKAIVENLSEMTDLPLINLVNAGNEEKGTRLLGLNTETELEIEDWLSYIKNCELYIGDSFHGICFSIIFKKDFILIRNVVSPSRCRFDTLLSLLGLEERSLYANEDIRLRKDLLAPIDWDAVYSKLNILINKSSRWLDVALNTEKEQFMTDYDCLSGEVAALKKENRILKSKIRELYNIVNREFNNE